MIPRGCDYASVSPAAGANTLARSDAPRIRLTEAGLATGPQ